MNLLTEALITSLQSASSEADFPDEVPARILEEISALVPMEGIRSHYVVVGPLPEFPGTKLDIWILTKKTLYNYMVDDNAAVTWLALPLAHLAYLSEAESRDGWSTLRIFGDSGSHSLSIQEKASNWDELLRRFVSELISSI